MFIIVLRQSEIFTDVHVLFRIISIGDLTFNVLNVERNTFYCKF